MTRVVGRDSYSGDGAEFDFWRDHTHISLQPVATPSVLGLFGLAAATFMVGANLAGWFGNTATPLFLFPLAAILGGLAQFMAGMWAFRARDTVAAAMHGTWGSFWLAYGLLYLLVATGTLHPPTPFVALGYWFIVLAAITWSGSIAALGQNVGFAVVLFALAAGATCRAIGMTLGISISSTIGAYFFIAAGVLAWYVATAMMLEWSFKRVILPVGKIGAVSRPGRPARPAIQYQGGEPGVRVGQ